MKAFEQLESTGTCSMPFAAKSVRDVRVTVSGPYRLNPSFQRRADGGYWYAIHRPEGCTSWRVLPAHRAWSTLDARLASHPAATLEALEAALAGAFSAAAARVLLRFAVDAGILIPPPVLQ